MTTIDTAAPSAAHSGLTERSDRVSSSIAARLTTSDHKRLGQLLVGTGLVSLVGVAAVGGLLGFERIDASSTSLDAGAITQLFALYRVGLGLFVLAPLMLGLAVAVVPLQLGARSLAFPRLAAAGFWGWLFGMVLVIVSIVANGGPGGGATEFVALFISSFAVMLTGLTSIAISLATTVLTTRAPGMNMRRVPLFSWSVLVSALGLILMLPVAIGTTIYVYVSYRYNGGAFGGNVGLLGFAPATESANWLGFSLTQPSTYVYALPAIGFLAETVPVTAGRRMPMRGVVLGGLGLVGVAALGGVTQIRQTLPWTGTKLYLGDLFGDKLGDIVNYGFFNVTPVLGVMILLLVAPLAFLGARPRINVAFVFGFLGVGMILVGMAGGVLTGIEELRLIGTVFEEAAFVYIAYGATLGAMGGVVYWGPKLWGRRIDDKMAAPFALAGVGATVLATFPYYIAGFADQPADTVVFDYSGPQGLWNTLVTIGHGLMVVTVLGFLAVVLKSVRTGAAAGDDPWDAQTLEWATSSPPPANNFAQIHTVASPEPLVDLKPATERDRVNTRGKR